MCLGCLPVKPSHRGRNNKLISSQPYEMTISSQAHCMKLPAENKEWQSNFKCSSQHLQRKLPAENKEWQSKLRVQFTASSKIFFKTPWAFQTADTNMSQHADKTFHKGVFQHTYCFQAAQIHCCFNSKVMIEIAQTFKLVSFKFNADIVVWSHAHSLSPFFPRRTHSSRLDIKASGTSDAIGFINFVIGRMSLRPHCKMPGVRTKWTTSDFRLMT